MNTLPEIYIDADGIIHEIHYDKIISGPCTMYAAEKRNNLSTIKRPVLIQFINLQGYDVDIRDLPFELLLQSVNSVAYYLDPETCDVSKAKEILESFFFISKIPIPVEIFSDKNTALDWLCQFIPQKSRFDNCAE